MLATVIPYCVRIASGEDLDCLRTRSNISLMSKYPKYISSIKEETAHDLNGSMLVNHCCSSDYGYYCRGNNGPCMHIWSTYEVRTVRITAGTEQGCPAVSTKVGVCI